MPEEEGVFKNTKDLPFFLLGIAISLGFSKKANMGIYIAIVSGGDSVEQDQPTSTDKA